MKCLSETYEVVGVDKLEAEGVTRLDIVEEKEKLRELLEDVDVAIHLAWDVVEGGTALEPALNANKEMGETMYKLCLEEGVKRLIVASSVHASMGYIGYRPAEMEDHELLHTKKITTEDEVFPLGVYGASKVYLEALGRAYSARGLQTIVVRFGNVTEDNAFGEYPFWLSYRDCCHFIDRCVLAEELPQYSVFFAISNNPCNPFDLTDAKRLLNYNPQDSSYCPDT